MDAVHLCYIFLGAGTLFPWNAFITAADYYAERYPDWHLDRLITVSYLPTNLAVLAALIHHHHRVRPSLRILGGLSAFVVAVSLMPLVRA